MQYFTHGRREIRNGSRSGRELKGRIVAESSMSRWFTSTSTPTKVMSNLPESTVYLLTVEATFALIKCRWVLRYNSPDPSDSKYKARCISNIRIWYRERLVDGFSWDYFGLSIIITAITADRQNTPFSTPPLLFQATNSRNHTGCRPEFFFSLVPEFNFSRASGAERDDRMQAQEVVQYSIILELKHPFRICGSRSWALSSNGRRPPSCSDRWWRGAHFAQNWSAIKIFSFWKSNVRLHFLNTSPSEWGMAVKKALLCCRKWSAATHDEDRQYLLFDGHQTVSELSAGTSANLQPFVVI